MSIKERLLHMILFECSLLVLTTCVVVLFSRYEAPRIAGVAVMLSLVAMTWTFMYNWIFDQFVTGAREQRGVKIRVAHAVLFEASLLVAVLPIIAWGLNMNLWEVFLLDIGLTVMAVAYTYLFNWVYDHARLKFI